MGELFTNSPEIVLFWLLLNYLGANWSGLKNNSWIQSLCWAIQLLLACLSQLFALVRPSNETSTQFGRWFLIEIVVISTVGGDERTSTGQKRLERDLVAPPLSRGGNAS